MIQEYPGDFLLIMRCPTKRPFIPPTLHNASWSTYSKELAELWMRVADDPWWQMMFVATGMQDEIPPTAFVDPVDDVPNTPPTKPNEPPPLDKPSPPKEQQVPKRVHSSRPACFGCSKPEEPLLKAPGTKDAEAPGTKDSQAEPVSDMVELEVGSGDEDRQQGSIQYT